MIVSRDDTQSQNDQNENRSILQQTHHCSRMSLPGYSMIGRGSNGVHHRPRWCDQKKTCTQRCWSIVVFGFDVSLFATIPTTTVVVLPVSIFYWSTGRTSIQNQRDESLVAGRIAPCPYYTVVSIKEFGTAPATSEQLWNTVMKTIEASRKIAGPTMVVEVAVTDHTLGST
jgi:hypothetical protein